MCQPGRGAAAYRDPQTLDLQALDAVAIGLLGQRHTTCRAPLRLTRSDSSRAVSPTWQGITAAPSLRQASRVSHSSGRASSTTRTRCPG